jgi:AI-2 transport protein TqsA
MMSEDARKVQATRILVTAASVVILISGLKLAQDFFIPVLLAAFIATISFPITSWLRRHKVPRFFAVLSTVLVDFAFLTGLILIVITLMGDLDAKWQNKYYPAMNVKIAEASQTAVTVLERWNVPDAEEKVRQYTEINIPQQLPKA